MAASCRLSVRLGVWLWEKVASAHRAASWCQAPARLAISEQTRGEAWPSGKEVRLPPPGPRTGIILALLPSFVPFPPISEAVRPWGKGWAWGGHLRAGEGSELVLCREGVTQEEEGGILRTWELANDVTTLGSHTVSASPRPRPCHPLQSLVPSEPLSPSSSYSSEIPSLAPLSPLAEAGVSMETTSPPHSQSHPISRGRETEIWRSPYPW